jgi:hypothetical protein
MGAILSVYEWRDEVEPTAAGGTRSVKRAVEIEDKRIVLKGPAQPGTAAGTINPSNTASGYGLTHGVDREVWVQWLADNKNSPLIRNRIIFAADNPERAADESRELQDIRSGLEPIAVPAPGERIMDRRIERARLMPRTFEGRRG